MTDCGLVCVPGAPGTALATVGCTGCWPRVDTCAGMEYSCDWFGRTCTEAEADLIAVVAVVVE
jgi:hypothetical protein